MGLYHPPDCVINLKYKLLYFLTSIIKNQRERHNAFNRDRCCHLAICLWLILFHCFNTSISSCLETSEGQNSNLYLNVVHFSTPVLIRNLWQLKTIVFLHWCVILALLLQADIFVYYTRLTKV